MAQFLSQEWLTAAHEIYAEHAGDIPGAPADIQVNLVVNDAPFGDGAVQAHLDTTGGGPEIGAGHIEGAATTVTTDYGTAKSIFADGNQQAAMQAFMGGKIQITGDMTQLMMLMQQPPNPAADEIAAELKSITD